MGVFIYNIFLLLFRSGTFLVSAFNPKARKWVKGRKNIFDKLRSAIPGGDPIVWMHCASLGEFEQGRPLLEKLRLHYPTHKFLLTFFSPSGYEVRKDYEGADWVFYLPMDGALNAKRFLEIVKPALVIFVKYEFWYYYLKKIKYRNIPLLLVSAIFRKDMSFFKWYGAIQRKILSRFDHLFVQDENSMKLMQEIGLGSICSISGDTRFDRVTEIAEKFQPLPLIEQFIGDSKCIIAGSTWPEDEAVLEKAFDSLEEQGIKLVLAPHEVTEKHLNEIKAIFPRSIRFSELAIESDLTKGKTGIATAGVLIIDNIGMLSRLYKYGYLTYVGGGLRSAGVHNVLEAAVYDKIVLFGPYYQKYSEAIGLVQSGGGLSFQDEKRDGRLLQQLINALLKDEEEYRFRSRSAGDFVRSQRGATDRIIRFIQEKRLLTN